MCFVIFQPLTLSKAQVASTGVTINLCLSSEGSTFLSDPTYSLYVCRSHTGHHFIATVWLQSCLDGCHPARQQEPENIKHTQQLHMKSKYACQNSTKQTCGLGHICGNTNGIVSTGEDLFPNICPAGRAVLVLWIWKDHCWFPVQSPSVSDVEIKSLDFSSAYCNDSYSHTLDVFQVFCKFLTASTII